ncbi:hypothetical protein OAN98_02200 [Bacteroidia bacterium]|nr:hypothetical protein [Bacteroidia bacterium]
MFKLYYPKELHISDIRSEIFPLLKPFLKGLNYSNEQRILDYGISKDDFVLTDNILDADILILSMSWNIYIQNNQIGKVIDFIKKNYNKKIYSFITGDYGVDTPNFENLIVLRLNGCKSKLTENHIGLPVFINDPLLKQYGSSFLSIDYSENPIVGFCGQSNYSIKNAVKEYCRVLIRNIAYFLNLTAHQPQNLLSTSYLRGKVLNKIKKSVSITDIFIERKKYRAGVKTEEDKKKTTQEFYENIKNSHYTICVRGGGNFSVRIYETLAMGRIPVFVNTDCLLPLSIDDEWRKHIFWIEKDEIEHLPRKLIEFHSKFDVESFEKYLYSNRIFWENKLTLSSYFKCLFQLTNSKI